VPQNATTIPIIKQPVPTIEQRRAYVVKLKVSCYICMLF
jgi:hypothetical protein